MVDTMFKTPFISSTGLVVSEHPLASVVGAKVLSSGGNAVDAAIATSFALSVLQPQLSGLGGDYFALIYIASEGKVYFIIICNTYFH
jgi:gamma-glutamyltranspeptidase/glutathione hydrolase